MSLQTAFVHVHLNLLRVRADSLLYATELEERGYYHISINARERESAPAFGLMASLTGPGRVRSY
jgi:hypothetical protein